VGSLKSEFPPEKRGGAPAPKSEPYTGAAFPPKRLDPKLMLELPNMLPPETDEPPVAFVFAVSPKSVVEPNIDPDVAWLDAFPKREPVVDGWNVNLKGSGFLEVTRLLSDCVSLFSYTKPPKRPNFPLLPPSLLD
jgi:hypothetical protein